jgi:hypothetical protein
VRVGEPHRSATDFRFDPNNGHRAARGSCPKSTISRSRLVSFDHLIGASEFGPGAALDVVIDRAPADDVAPKVRRIMRVRAFLTLCLFGVAAVAALKFPLVGLGICCCCLIVYLKPEAPGV